MSAVRYIGIDPGQGGGIAILSADGAVVQTFKMPATERDLLDTLAPYGGDGRADSDGGTPARAVLERVSSSPQMGVVSAFTFGKGYGGLRMALVATGIPFDEVTPQKWQSAIGVIYPKKSAQTVKKNIAKRRAQELFPHGVKVTHANGDALLLAEYLRRLEIRP